MKTLYNYINESAGLSDKFISELQTAINTANLNITGSRFDSAETQENNILAAFKSDTYTGKQLKNKSNYDWIRIDREYGDLMFSKKGESIYVDIKVSSEKNPNQFPTISMDSICSFCTTGNLKNKYYVCIKRFNKDILILNANDITKLINTKEFNKYIYPCSTHNNEDKSINITINGENFKTTTRSYIKPDDINRLINNEKHSILNR